MKDVRVRASVNDARYYETQSTLYIAIVLGVCAVLGLLVVGHMVMSVMAELGNALAVAG